MLTPEYLDRCTDVLLGMYDVLDRILIGDIARELAAQARVDGRLLHMMIRYDAAGGLMRRMTEHISQVTGLAEKEIERLYRDATRECMAGNYSRIGQKPRPMSPDMQQTVFAQVAKTRGEVRNLTMTTASQAFQSYVQAATNAEMLVESGAMSYDEAITRAILDAASDGVRVAYPSGHTDHLDVAVRRAVLTGVSQTTGKLTELFSEENGVEYYEVSAHAGARPEHAAWQGQVYKIHGSDRNYKNFYDATDYGSGTGLCGYNCRHNFFPFVPGVSVRAYTKEKLKEYDAKKISYNGAKYTEYEAQQMMRARERKIRQLKRESSALGSAQDAARQKKLTATLATESDEMNSELREAQREYRQFCRKINRSPQMERTRVVEIEDAGRILGFKRLAEGV